MKKIFYEMNTKNCEHDVAENVTLDRLNYEIGLYSYSTILSFQILHCHVWCN